jgi:predicted RecB family endonuclease
VDIALVLASGSVEVGRQVHDAIQVLADRLGVRISPVVLAPADVAKLSLTDHPWWAELCRDARILKGVAPAKEAARCAKAAPRA